MHPSFHTLWMIAMFHGINPSLPYALHVVTAFLVQRSAFAAITNVQTMSIAPYIATIGENAIPQLSPAHRMATASCNAATKSRVAVSPSSAAQSNHSTSPAATHQLAETLPS